MADIIHLWSKEYAPVPCSDQFSAQISEDLWKKIMRDEEGARHFIRIGDWVVPCGNPVIMEESDENHVFLPLWMIDSGHFYGNGEELEAEILSEESFPCATRIVLKVVDSAFYNSDVKDELEKALSAIGVIRAHTTLQIPIKALGNYPVDIFVSETEPANIVLCDGEEVIVEFEEPVDHAMPIQTPLPVERPGTPIPPPVEIFDSFIPIAEEKSSWTAAGAGNVLGTSSIVATIPAWRLAVPHRPRP